MHLYEYIAFRAGSLSALTSKSFSAPRRRLFLHALPGFLVSLLRVLESLSRVFQCLPRVLVSRLMILFPMMHGCGPVRMGGKVVVFSGSFVRITWHDVTSFRK